MRPRKGVALESVKIFDPYSDVQMEKIMKNFSFIRISIEEILMTEDSELLNKLQATGQLYGFQIEYSFPCLGAVSSQLQSTVRIPSKLVTSSKIEFKHKKVALLTMHKDQISMWQKTRLTIHLLVSIQSPSKFTTRPLAKCSIPLYELLVVPYMICRDFDFVGSDFVGSALIKIDLGTRVKSIMEKLETLRVDRSLNETYVVEKNGRRTRSRSSSRCHSRHGDPDVEEEWENRKLLNRDVIELSTSPREFRKKVSSSRSASSSTPFYDRNMAASTSSIESDSVFRNEENRRIKPIHPTEYMDDERIFMQKPTRIENTCEEIGYEGKFYLQLTVHKARGLPPIEDEDGRITSPNAFISVLGREGELRSEVIKHSREPVWNWTARFAMSSERKNLVVKVIHRGLTGDRALGFVTIALPVMTTRKAFFEMTDVSRMNHFTSETPILVISIEKIKSRELEEIQLIERRSATTPTTTHRTTDQSTQSSPWMKRAESPEITESSEEIMKKLRKNMGELGELVENIKK